MMFVTAVLLLAVFDPSATMRAFQHEEARPGAIRQLLRLEGEALQQAQSDAALTSMLSLMAVDQALDLESRIWSIRAIGRLQCVDCASYLGSLLLGEAPEAVALAREAARSLALLSSGELLAAGLSSRDPELRAEVAEHAALSVEQRCALLADPWPMVRLGAARGLGREADRGCLTQALQDREVSVRRAAAESAGGFRDVRAVAADRVEPTDAAREALKTALEARAADRREKEDVRSAALIALGRLGEVTKARKVVETHLKKGGLLALTEASIFAISQQPLSSEDRALLGEAAGSKEPNVAFAALRAIHCEDRALAVELYKKHRPKLTESQREQVLRWSDALKPARDLADFDERAGFVDGQPVEDEDFDEAE